MFLYEINQGEVKIKGVYSYSNKIEIPNEIEGYPVTELDSYLFADTEKEEKEIPAAAGKNLKEISLPIGLKKIGNYAFYNCTCLEKIQLSSGIFDIGSGVFMGCRELKEIEIQIIEGKRSCLKEILSEVHNQVLVWYHSIQGMAKLIFPEFFEEAVENTPARILLTQTHGCGHRYRYCFQQTAFQFREYDRLFSYARQQEERKTSLNLALGRILYPTELSQKAKEEYMEYIRRYLIDAAKIVIKQEETKKILFFAELFLKKQEDFEQVIEAVSREENRESLSILMDFRHQNFKAQRKQFKL